MEAKMLRESIEVWLKATRENFERDGEVLPIALLLVRQNLDGKPFEGPTGCAPAFFPLLSLMASPEKKELAATAIRQIAYQQKAVLVMVITEAWVLEAHDRGSPAWKEAMEAGASGTVYKHPKRREVITAMVEGVFGINEVHSASIIREEGKKPTLGPWSVMAMNTMLGHHNEGRFSDFIPPDALA